MLVLLIALSLPTSAPAAEVELLRDCFDNATAGEPSGTAVYAPGVDGQALRLEGELGVVYDAPLPSPLAGRIEMRVCPHAPIEPRADEKHWSLFTDVGADSAWRGATVIYWDGRTGELSYGVFDQGWHWLTAAGINWPVGEWRSLAFTYGPEGRTLLVGDTVVARDAYAKGIEPRAMHLGYVDVYSDAAPVLVDDLTLTCELVDGLRVSRGVICPEPDGLLESVAVNWTMAEPGAVSIELCTPDGEPVAPIAPSGEAEPGVYATEWTGGDVPTGDYEARMTVERPGAPSVVLRAPISVERGLRCGPPLGRMADVFPIAAWYIWENDCVHDGTHIDDLQAARDYYDWTMGDLSRLGIDTIMADWTPRDHREIMLDAAEENDIRVIVHLDEVNHLLWHPELLEDGNFVRTFREAVATANTHPATLGYYMVDEPPATPENIANLRMARRLLQALDPERPGFSCLNWGWEATFPGVGYEVLLVDIYPVYWDRLKGDVLTGYIDQLDRAHRAAAGAPLWVIPQCFGFGGENPHGIPAPNEVSLMVWEAVAHGAKGIMYFIYQSTTGIQGEWLRGIVDERLQPMDHRYREVRRVNASLARVSETLLQLTRDPAPIASAEGSVDVQGFVHADGTRYLCVVNQDTDAPVETRLRFEPPHGDRIADVVDVADGCALGSPGDAVASLGPGEGRLLRLVDRREER